MEEPRWFQMSLVNVIHDDQIRQHGGSHGIRDQGLLESALSRPLNRWNYEPDVDVADLAASYGFGLARNHPYFDGNKRVAFQVMYVFLGLNGHRIIARETEVVITILKLASGELTEDELATWLRQHTQPR
jgi:death on curing protein